MEACLCSLADRISHHWAEQQPQPQPQQQPQQHLPGPSWPVVVEMLRQVAEALAFLHREGKAILHNDVRAANMLLTRQEGGGGARWKLKICDFGLAVEAGAAQQALSASLTNPGWRAPELAPSYDLHTNMFTVTAAADVYALGCVLHEMMTLEWPLNEFPPAGRRLPLLQDPEPAPWLLCSTTV